MDKPHRSSHHGRRRLVAATTCALAALGLLLAAGWHHARQRTALSAARGELATVGAVHRALLADHALAIDQLATQTAIIDSLTAQLDDAQIRVDHRDEQLALWRDRHDQRAADALRWESAAADAVAAAQAQQRAWIEERRRHEALGATETERWQQRVSILEREATVLQQRVEASAPLAEIRHIAADRPLVALAVADGAVWPVGSRLLLADKGTVLAAGTVVDQRPDGLLLQTVGQPPASATSKLVKGQKLGILHTETQILP
jgi:hypothetical protein